MRFFFETYGCQMNRAESASIEQMLLRRGWTASQSAQKAQLIIINTCSVRETAETRITGRLGWYLALRKERGDSDPFVLTVTGCMAERLQSEFKQQYPIIDYVVGNFNKAEYENIAKGIELAKKSFLTLRTLDTNLFSAFAKKQEEDFKTKPVYSFAPLSLEPGAFQAFVPIMHGCNNFCTYCIVPYVRGREVSRSLTDILNEIDILSSQNVKEITVLGQNVNSYHFKDGNHIVDFPELMQIIAQHLEKNNASIEWIRFMSSHPKDFSDDLISIIRDNPRICKHIHLPVQHGSTTILKRMNRSYTAEEYMMLVQKIRAQIPHVSLTTDILIGFPSETEQDFEQTLELLKQVRYQTAFMYYYNPRKGTPAANFSKQISIKDKKARLAQIIAIQQEITKQEFQKRIGTKARVLAESVSKNNKNELLGHTEQDERVVFAADKKNIGSFQEVSLHELHGNTFRATIV